MLYDHNMNTTNDSNKSYWKRQQDTRIFELFPPASLSYNNGRKPARYSLSRLSSSMPLFPTWPQLSHPSMHERAPTAINNTAEQNSSKNNTTRTLLTNGTRRLSTIKSLPVVQITPMESSVPSTVELLDASSPTTITTTISLQSANKTPSTTENILVTSKRPVIIVYPTVSPESIVVPIVSCIFGFPLLALLVICCLRRRAKLARERERRRNYDMQDHAVSLVRFSPIHRLNNRSSRVISLRPERSLSRGFPSLELDTVIEERSDQEHTQTDLLSPESPTVPPKFSGFNVS